MRCARHDSAESPSTTRRQPLCDLDLDLDVHTRGEVEALEAVDCLGAGLEDVEETPRLLLIRAL